VLFRVFQAFMRLFGFLPSTCFWLSVYFGNHAQAKISAILRTNLRTNQGGAKAPPLFA
jgi:hypothetical protein